MFPSMFIWHEQWRATRLRRTGCGSAFDQPGQAGCAQKAGFPGHFRQNGTAALQPIPPHLSHVPHSGTKTLAIGRQGSHMRQTAGFRRSRDKRQ
jgi:hypothetical protein